MTDRLTRILLILAVFMFLINIDAAAQTAPWKVEYSGAMREMFSSGDVTGKVEIQKLTSQKGLYGVGPLDNLGGEIMIWNGSPLTSFVRNNDVVIESNSSAKAVFFVWANVTKWRAVSVPPTVSGYDQLEEFIAAEAARFGIGGDAPFPFLIKGVFGSVAWHINDYKSDGRKITREIHDAMKYKKTSNNAKLEFLGFYSTKHKGIFTHHTRTTHIHVTDKNRTFIGHVDDLTGRTDVKLYLPVR